MRDEASKLPPSARAEARASRQPLVHFKTTPPAAIVSSTAHERNEAGTPPPAMPTKRQFNRSSLACTRMLNCASDRVSGGRELDPPMQTRRVTTRCSIQRRTSGLLGWVTTKRERVQS